MNLFKIFAIIHFGHFLRNNNTNSAMGIFPCLDIYALLANDGAYIFFCLFLPSIVLCVNIAGRVIETYSHTLLKLSQLLSK